MNAPTLKQTLHRPVIDLRTSHDAEFFSNATAMAAESLLVHDIHPIWIQRRNPPGFRNQVWSEAFGGSTLESSPLSPPLREPPSDGWRALEDHLGAWNALDHVRKRKTARTLVMMGEYAHALELLKDSTADISLELFKITIQVGLYRAGYLAQLDCRALACQCRRLATEPHAAPTDRIGAGILAFLLLLQHGDQVLAVGELYDILVDEECRLAADADFVSVSLRSRIWRAAAMYSQLRGDMARMHAEMQQAEDLALLAPACNATERFIRQENLFSVYESRTKEYLAANRLDQALSYANCLVELFPFNSAARIELGEVLLKREDYSAAATQYALAAAYAPPGAALASFMAGECFRLSGRRACAMASYVRAHQRDRDAYSALEQAAQVAHTDRRDRAVRLWSTASQR